MSRFLIVAGIMFTAVAAIELTGDIQEIAPPPAAVLPDKASALVPAPAILQASVEQTASTIDGARHLAHGAAVAAADMQGDDALVTSSQILSSGSLDSPRETIDATLVLLSPYEMTTAVQTELDRLACYDAVVDGVWGSKSRAAVRLFNKRSNASFHLNESVELLTALKQAPNGLCDDRCADGGSCEIVASAAIEADTPAQPEAVAEKQQAPSYLPPWMRGKELTEVSGDTEVSESYSATQTSVTRRIRVRVERPEPRVRYRSASRKKDWLPRGWPGSD